MNSKEALEILVSKTSILDDTCANLKKCIKTKKCRFNEPCETCEDYNLFKVISQELERLEQLEGLVKTLDIEVKILNQDLEKYKMAIEILKDFFNVGEIYGDYLINANGFNKLSKLDYELLKEVLENETNN